MKGEPNCNEVIVKLKKIKCQLCEKGERKKRRGKNSVRSEIMCYLVQ